MACLGQIRDIPITGFERTAAAMAPDLSSCDEFWYAQTSSAGWERAYHEQCEINQQNIAKIKYLEMRISAEEVRIACLTRENQRLNLTMRHLVCVTIRHTVYFLTIYQGTVG